jgi:hypothetical protein
MDVAGRWRNSYRLFSLEVSKSHSVQCLNNIDRICKSVRNILQTENAGCAGEARTKSIIVVVAVVAVVVAVAVYRLFPLVTQAICEVSPSHSLARQTLNLAPRFVAFSCFPQNGPFAGLLRSCSPCGSLRIPIHCLLYSV